MARVLIVSTVELSAALGRTVIWRDGVTRLAVADPEAAIALATDETPGLLLLDAPAGRSLEWVEQLARHPATRDARIAVLDRGGLDAAAERALIAAGARVVLAVPVDPLLWDTRLQELLSLPARRQARVPVRLETWSRLGPRGETIEGRALDLSQRGMRLETQVAPAIGSKLDIRFRLPGDEAELDVMGEVVRYAGRSENDLHLSGIEFRVARGDARRRIAAFIEAAVRGAASPQPAATENREWEAALRDDAARKSAILDSTLDGVLSVDPEGIIVECNPAAAALFGWGQAELYGSRAERLVPDALRDEFRDGLRRLLSDEERRGDGRRFEAEALRQDGSSFPVEVSVAPTWVGGRLLATACLRDVTERKAAENALRESERRYRLLSERMSQTVATLRAAEAELQRSVRHDPLTGLSNRRFFLETLGKTLSQSIRAGAPLALLFVDLDGFKTINDQLGHQAGDAVLRAVGQRLQSAVRTADAVARIGGDEFTILIHNPARTDDAARIAEKVLETIGRPFVLPEGEVQVTASVGISLFPGDGADADTLMRHADLAMYRAKEEGRATCRFFTPALSERARERLELETDLRSALARQQLRLHYQPVVDGQARPVGLEALLRWKHPLHGLLLPERFLGPATESGLMVPIGEWVLGEACRSLDRHDARGLRVSVNISPRECAHPGLLERVRAGLSAAGLDPARLELELSGAPLQEAERVAGRLRRVRALGVALSFDDFGATGVSPAWLRKAGFDRLKLEPALVTDLTRDADARAVASGILAMARALQLDVVAQGVETREQLEALRELGCDLFQGDLFGGAMAPDPLRRWLVNSPPPPES